ncbi:hypothetical protein KUW14_02080 [Pseudooceanicola nitratireducens]|uniref:hypothetical protein n=1 Tax=Pseudooceanicola nitratireducens TaxID=517719 RepID=UPI001C97D701|nr:hypothetical protein [Pseudooceanicola nitratireducens]MBY6164623.1 hypothetical protein [Pseudooceanicola nitratireducens]
MFHDQTPFADPGVSAMTTETQAFTGLVTLLARAHVRRLAQTAQPANDNRPPKSEDR